MWTRLVHYLRHTHCPLLQIVFPISIIPLLSPFSAPPPLVKWAQRPNLIFLTVCLEDCKEPKIQVDADKLYFKGIGGPENKEHEVTIEFLKEIDTEAKNYYYSVIRTRSRMVLSEVQVRCPRSRHRVRPGEEGRRSLLGEAAQGQGQAALAQSGLQQVERRGRVGRRRRRRRKGSRLGRGNSKSSILAKRERDKLQ